MISWETIDFKGKSNGEVNVVCPACSHTRKPANQKKPCLQVNFEKGVGKCYHCHDVTVREPKKETKIYDAPPQEWQNYTNIPDKVVQWFKNERGISQQTLIDCKITHEQHFQPSHGKSVGNIVFNYFEGSKLLNKKFRSGAKKFTQCKNAKKVFYGINDAIGEKSVYIVEGEMDKLAMWEIGIKNCISIPNGANDVNSVFETCGVYLENIEKVYIAVDTDEAGLEAEKDLLKRFGKWRCERIEFPNGKDANDELLSGALNLEKAVNSPKPYPVDGSFSAQDIIEDILELWENGYTKTLKPTSKRFKGLNDIFSIIPGQLTTITGIPSHGKSTFVEDYATQMIVDCNLKASFFSPEHLPMQNHQAVLCSKVMGKPFFHDYNAPGDSVPKITKEEIEKYADWSKDKLFLLNPGKDETANWDYLFKKFKEQMFRYGVDLIVVDAWNKVRMKKPGDLAEINQILADLTSFAQGYGVSVLLIAHPRKMGKDADGLVIAPDLYDVKGSGDFRDQTHNGLGVYRFFADEEHPETEYQKGFTVVENLKTKFQHQGQIGENAEFYYDPPTTRYFPVGSEPTRGCLFDPQPETQEKIQAAIVPNPDEWITSSKAEPLEDVDF